MAARNTVYSANAWSFNYAGLQIETGKGPDEFLKVSQQDDDFTMQVGLDGESVFSQNLNTATDVSLTLLHTSRGNAVLSAIHNASKIAGGQPAPLAIADRNGTSKTISPSAIIKKMPDETVGKEVGVIVWEFLVHQPERFVGSH